MNLLLPLMADIKEHTKKLNALLSHIAILQTEVFSLPEYSKDDEIQLLGQGLKYCHVEHSSGKQALKLAQQAFIDMHIYDSNLSTRFTRKHLGLITINSHQGDIIQLCNSINRAKDEFKSEVQTLGNEDEKFKEVHKALPGLVTSMAYRKIHYRENVKTLYFNWAKRSRSEKVNIDKLIEQLENGTGKAAFRNLAQRERELAILDEHRHRTLRYKRPINIRPECSIRSNDNKMLGMTVGNPIIVFSPNSIRFTPLNTYSPSLNPVNQVVLNGNV
ncbi:DNA replication terminus site-binding protein [Paraglaciecola aquimarina]|uniref:DNA replication terminus site-binding protein n=1 Tax=Paraglaciecola aquimarina TaxID=1235557 RepID=A0ABU3SRA3_9ALTE|nr:DNA replication terminus site-binding protein [Paraglaciecola aquimarina]MDU0352532.1 DNA replication terminus site-binding protein [Paraglaciecola aquimarina]